MTGTTNPMLGEFHEEAAITKRVLDRVPPDKLSWKPHAKSMTLGQLAVHIATVPGALARITQEEAFDVSQGNFVPPQPNNVEEIHAAFEQSVREVDEYLEGMTDQKAQGNWRLMLKARSLKQRPTIENMVGSAGLEPATSCL